jgi:hypothetical protein
LRPAWARFVDQLRLGDAVGGLRMVRCVGNERGRRGVGALARPSRHDGDHAATLGRAPGSSSDGGTTDEVFRERSGSAPPFVSVEAPLGELPGLRRRIGAKRSRSGE